MLSNIIILLLNAVKIVHVTCFVTLLLISSMAICNWCWFHISGSGELGLVEEVDCSNSTHGCCPDGIRVATGPNFEGCDVINADNCTVSYFGCCPDGVSPGMWLVQYIGWNCKTHTYI
jgi:hypothetical protein